MIYNLKEKTELDKEGRPAIYLGFIEETKEHKFICGTSSKKDKDNEILKLFLSKETYFYVDNIRSINNDNIEKSINDFWARDFKTNKPVDFLFGFPEKIEQLKEKYKEELIITLSKRQSRPKEISIEDWQTAGISSQIPEQSKPLPFDWKKAKSINNEERKGRANNAHSNAKPPTHS